MADAAGSAGVADGRAADWAGRDVIGEDIGYWILGNARQGSSDRDVSSVERSRLGTAGLDMAAQLRCL